MNATTIQATINNADFPIIQHLFERLKIKTTILETVTVDDKKKSIPVEKSIPNEETHKAFMEMRENRHSMKGYTDVNLMIKDILEEDE
ncbi:antitoxin [Capnocytophaga leadbetteri]|uniref:antitoxin n=1 Tax=Capnocytophaga leadbetteri TaxID=327575 RepID=UPI0028E8EF6E|nr:antitoxin [Capnocytophaga leadbetteri]